MSTGLAQRSEAPVEDLAAPTPDKLRTGPSRRNLILIAVGVLTVVLAVVLQNVATLTVARSDLSGFQLWVNGVRDAFGELHGSNPIIRVLDAVTNGLNGLIALLQNIFSQAPPGRPTPQVGWLGVIALAIWAVFAVSGWRLAVLCAVVFAAFGTFGFWPESIDTLIITLVSMVFVLIIGIPLGLWMGNSRRATAVITPLLDLMQTIPSFAYLIPIVLLFGIGGAPAVVATWIYAVPPVIRIAAEGIRGVAPGALEAAGSLGVTAGQRLLKVQLPMARRTIIVGINQSMMAALSMVTIAAFVNSPGLGVPIVTALASLDVGTSFTAGILIALIAILLDRATTAAGERTRLMRTLTQIRRRRIGVAAGLIVVGVAIYYSHLFLGLAEFPSSPNLGQPLSRGAQAVADFVSDHADALTGPISRGFTIGLLNPFQALVANSPWWLIAIALIAVSGLVAGLRSFLTTVVCLGIILAVGIWHEAMITLATALVATVIVIVLTLIFGVLTANSKQADLIIRPILDTAQTIPALVYLVPALALFGPTRFTAIVAAVVYGAPVAIKLVCDGIQGVSPTTIEAARSVGTNRWQLVSRVQLPMARSSVALAANQGLLYVFAVVVIGGLVGAGGLGYLVVAGFSQFDLYGKGVAAGIAIAALAIMFDRMAQGWVRRSGR